MIEKFSIVLTVNMYNPVNSQLVDAIEEELNALIRLKEYGEGVKYIILGLVATDPKFQEFAKKTKPDYKKEKDIVNPHVNPPVVIEKVVSYQFSIDHQTYVLGSEVELFNAVKKGLLESLNSIDQLTIPDFDKERYKEDFVRIVNEMQIES